MEKKIDENKKYYKVYRITNDGHINIIAAVTKKEYADQCLLQNLVIDKKYKTKSLYKIIYGTLENSDKSFTKFVEKLKEKAEEK